MAWRSRYLLACLVLLACGGEAALAGSDHRLGDGAEADNPDLLKAAGAVTDSALGRGNLREPYQPFFDIDWQVGLSGAYQRGAKGQSFETLLVPEVSFSHEGRRATIEGAAGAELARSSDGETMIRALRFSVGSGYAFDQVSKLMVEGDFALNQQGRNDPDLAGDVLDPPLEIRGGASAEFTRQFGHFALAVRSAVNRDVYGPSTLLSGVHVDNSARNVTGIDGGVRLSYAVTPIISVFADAEAGRDKFDAPFSDLGVKLDGPSYALRTGVSGNWREIWKAEASLGIGLREFDDPSLNPIRATLYDASLSFSPDETFALRASFSSEIAPPAPDIDAAAEIAYRAGADAEYRMNSWLSLRAKADWFLAQAQGDGGQLRKGFGAGIGADYRLNSHAEISADYEFSRSEKAATPAEDTHAVTLGLSFSR